MSFGFPFDCGENVRRIVVIRFAYCTILGLFCAFDATTCLSAEQSWRRSEQDGVNCAVVFLKSHGAEVSYAELDRRLQLANGHASLLDVKNAIEMQGMAVEIIRCAPDEQLFRRCPAIVALKDDRSDETDFVILIEQSETFVTLLFGGVAMIKRKPWDEFRRCWTGIAIVKAETRPILTWRRLLIGACALIGIVFCIKSRMHPAI